MGADFLMSRLPFNISIKDIEKGEWKKILIKEIKKSDLKSDEWFGVMEYTQEDEKGTKERLIEAINDFSINTRDVSYFEQDGIINVISGGMSWGDSPTEMFDTLGIISEVPEEILNKAGIVFSNNILSQDKKFLSQDKEFEKKIVSYFQAQGWQEQDMLLQKINKVLVNKLWSKK